mgnify:CR=1 FL=1
MIKGVHAMFFTDQAEEARAFARDKLKLDNFDAGGGWLIFKIAEADMGFHPVDHEGAPPSGTHDISFYCDDLEAEVAGMKERGVEFKDEITDQGFGFVIHFEMPGGIRCQLYQPKYGK